LVDKPLEKQSLGKPRGWEYTLGWVLSRKIVRMGCRWTISELLPVVINGDETLRDIRWILLIM
jgi:hypothetical protein